MFSWKFLHIWSCTGNALTLHWQPSVMLGSTFLRTPLTCSIWIPKHFCGTRTCNHHLHLLCMDRMSGWAAWKQYCLPLRPAGDGAQSQKEMQNFPFKALRWSVLNQNEEGGKFRKSAGLFLFSYMVCFFLTSSFQSIKMVLNLQQILEK